MSGGKSKRLFIEIDVKFNSSIINLCFQPISLQDKNSAASAVLNVEEKKVKERTSYSNNMRNNPNDNLSPRPPRDNTGPRRGPLPGGGQPRSAGGPMGGGGGGGQRPNTFNRGGGQANRAGGPNTYTRR